MLGSYSKPVGWERLSWGVVERLRNPIAVFDERGSHLAVNAATCEFFGVSRDEFDQSRLGYLLTPAGHATLDDEWRQLWAKRDLSGARVFTRADGSRTWNWEEVGGIFTINRSLQVPYFNAADSAVGSSATVARIGDQVYATVPGEGFPEVTEAIERAFASSPGIKAAHVIDEGSDTLGYFGDYAAYPPEQMQGDLATNNVGPNVGQDTVNAIVQAGESLGLGPAPEQVTADITNPQAFSQPGIQFYPNQVETEEPTVSFYASTHAADPASHSTSTTIGSSAGTQGDGLISWNFGDGTTEVQPDSARFTHTFPGPGLYAVTASVTDNLGNTYSWTQSVRIDAPLSAAVVQTAGPRGSVVLSAVGQGGEGNVLEARWTFSHGKAAYGTTITVHKHLEGLVTITDGAGNTATAGVHVN